MYLVDSYCGVKLLARVTRPDMPDGFYGCLVEKSDIKKLNDAGVPTTSMTEEFFVFDYHIIKRVNWNVKKRRSSNIHRRKA